MAKGTSGGGRSRRRRRSTKKATAQVARARRAEARETDRRARLERRRAARTRERVARRRVYGDAAYGTGEFLDHLATNDIDARCKTQPPTAAGGSFAKDRFDIDLEDGTVTCPAGVTAAIRRNDEGDGTACFGDACADCALRADCTKAEGGRTIAVGRHEKRLADARAQRQDPSGSTITARPAPRSSASSAT